MKKPPAGEAVKVDPEALPQNPPEAIPLIVAVVHWALVSNIHNAANKVPNVLIKVELIFMALNIN